MLKCISLKRVYLVKVQIFFKDFQLISFENIQLLKSYFKTNILAKCFVLKILNNFVFFNKLSLKLFFSNEYFIFY